MLRAMTVLGCCVCCLPAFAADPPQPRDMAVLEKEFAEKLSGGALVGTFSIDGRNGQPKSERYEIISANKVENSDWVITSRIKYGDKDVNLPVFVQVFWADDTPVITLTNRTIPGLGTFTARVMVYGDRYAGTWQHDQVGGHMWGKIETKKAEKEPEKDAVEKKKE
jgi:hypothetical protein